jgi:hypothetical protein
MNEKTKRVFRGWLELSSTEREEFQKAIDEYNRASETRKRELRESYDRVIKMQTGPLSQGCPCCGR